MGLLMDDLHSPSVLSGVATGQHSSDKSKEDVPLLELMAEKQQKEEELKALGSVLDSVSHGLKLPSDSEVIYRPDVSSTASLWIRASPLLTDFQGMISTSLKVCKSYHSARHKNVTNILLVRTTRARVIRLRNDYKAIMSKIEAGLHAHHASLRNTTVPASSELNSGAREASSKGTSNSSLLQTPFARINSVVSGSPADESGLRAGDRIRLFGAVNWMNHEKLSKVAEVVQESEGV